MKKPLTLLLLFTLGIVPALHARESKDDSIKKIGTYDSRSIAIAFMGSKVYDKTFGKVMTTKMAERKQAVKDGDKKKIAQLDAWGKAQQQRLHQQGFGTAPVTDILAHIEKTLPALKKKAGVDLLVSKWDSKTLEKHKAAETVDVTLSLVDAFQPSEKQKKHALEIQKKDPVPLDKLKGGHRK